MNESLNRAFLYGESVFTTMRMVQGAVRDWDLHFDRLMKGAEFLYGPFKGDDWKIQFRDRLEAKLAQDSDDKVIRLTIYHNQERGLLKAGGVLPADLKIHSTSSLLDPSRIEGKVLKLRTVPVTPKPYWWPNYLKAGNYLNTILSQKMFLKPEDDDLLFVSSEDTILESSVANIFVVKGEKLYTPPLGPNVLDGVMRRKVMDVGHHYFKEVIEAETSIDQLYRAEGVFGTNSVRGPFLIGRVDDRDITLIPSFLEGFQRLRARVME